MSIARREKILQVLRDKGVVMLKELETMFPEVSSMTLRRDLEFFENLGEAVRIRGGARYIRTLSGQEDVYALRAVKNQEAKDKIAKIAVRFIETRRSVFLDSGSTGMSLARALPDASFSILTSAPNIAMEVSKRYKPSVTIIGGLINRSNLSVSGMQSAQFIKSLNVDIAFITSSAYSPKNGFTCGYYSEAELKNMIIAKADKTILLMDSTKFGKSMPFTFASMQDIDVMVTDKRPDDEIMELAQKYGVSVLSE